MNIAPLSAGQRISLTAALGHEVVRVADRLQQSYERDGTAPASLWREFLATLYSTNADVMETPLGQLFTFAVVTRRIHRDAGAGYPGNGPVCALRPKGRG